MNTVQFGMSRRQLLAGLAAWAGSAPAQAAPLFRPAGLNHLTLNVSDLERSEAFYRKLFGGPQWAAPAAARAFDLGSNPLAIYLNPRGKPTGIDHLCIAVEALNPDAALSALQQRSVDAQKAGNRGILLHDPDRIAMELVSPGYRNPQAEPRKESGPSAQPLFRPIALNHVTLQVTDLARSTRFYESLFGPASKGRNGQTSSILTGTGGLGWITYGVNPIGIDHFCVSIEGYEPNAVSEKLKQNGIASQRLYQPDQVFVRDPDGILLQLAGADYGRPR